jgi:hypothetical protein
MINVTNVAVLRWNPLEIPADIDLLERKESKGRLEGRMTEAPQDAWRRSAYPYEVWDASEAQAILSQYIAERMEPQPPEEVQRFWRRMEELREYCHDFHVGIPLAFDRLQNLAIRTSEPELMQRVGWTMDAFWQWLQRVHN